MNALVGKDNMVVSYKTMRKAVGWLGMLLPFTLLIGNWLINHLDILNNPHWVVTNLGCVKPYAASGSFKSSISHYYYTTMGEMFTGVLSAVALFMFCYKGYKLREGEKGFSDSFVTNAAALFALGVVIFPTSSEESCCIADNMRVFMSSQLTGYIHFSFAALFFLALSYMCLVNFRRTSQVGVKGTGGRYTLYLLCGWVMLTCLLIIFIYSSWLAPKNDCSGRYHIVFTFETIALIAFGISWLTKGEVDYLYLPKKLGIVKKSNPELSKIV